MSYLGSVTRIDAGRVWVSIPAILGTDEVPAISVGAPHVGDGRANGYAVGDEVLVDEIQGAEADVFVVVCALTRTGTVVTP
jgi:hypothetical protein